MGFSGETLEADIILSGEAGKGVDQLKYMLGILLKMTQLVVVLSMSAWNPPDLDKNGITTASHY